jgi:O-antigen/teichoic acid export membrane protein
MFFLALPIFAGVAAVAPLASELWIGHYERSFVVYTSLLAAAYWLNTITVPAYFFNLGTGFLRWNTLSFVLMAPLNLALGYSLGAIFGGLGVVIGYLLALVIGSGFVILGFHRYHHIPLPELLSGESRRLFFACSVGLMSGWSAFYFFKVPLESLERATLSFTICIILIAPVLWVHPLRKKMSSKIVAAFTS